MTGPTFAAPAHAPVSPGGAHAPKPARQARPVARLGDKADEGGGLRVLTYLRLHWLMITFCGSLLGSAGAYAAWELLASKYESYGLFQVSSVPTAIANQNPNQARTDFVTYLKTTSTLIKSEFVLNAALRDMKDLPTIKAQSDPIKYLEEELQVTWQDGSEVIRVTFKGSEPQDAKKIVDAVQKAFMKEVIQKDVDMKKAFLTQVEDAQAKIRKMLDDRAEKQPKPGAAAQAGVAAAGGAPGAAAPAAGPAAPGLSSDELLIRHNPNILITKLVQLQQEVEKLPNYINAVNRRRDVLKDKLEELRKAPVPEAMQEMADKHPDVVAEKTNMDRARRQYEFRLNASSDPNAAGVRQFKALYEAQKRRYEEARQKKLDTLVSGQRSSIAGKIAAELEAVIAEGQKYEEQLEIAKKLLAKAQKQLFELPLPVEKTANGVQGRFDEKLYDAGTSVLESIDSIYRRLVLQYHLTQMELSSPPRVSILQPASHPTQKDTKKQTIGTVFGGLMGFVLIAMGVIAYETMCRRVSALADVKAAVPSPVVGVIPCQPGEAMGRDPAKRAAANEAIDKLRAYVSQTWLSRGATAIAVTSPIGDEGKAFTSFGLASSLAQAGYKTLLVDFDLREPALHAYAGVPNLAGVCELLRAETDMRSAVQLLPNGLHLLPAGKWSDEARKAATGEKLENLLAKLKEPYDCVVLHGHAILTVAESVEVARRCEVVLVCARYRETAMPLLKSAADRVATMEIPYTGVVYVGATEREALC